MLKSLRHGLDRWPQMGPQTPILRHVSPLCSAARSTAPSPRWGLLSNEADVGGPLCFAPHLSIADAHTHFPRRMDNSAFLSH